MPRSNDGLIYSAMLMRRAADEGKHPLDLLMLSLRQHPHLQVDAGEAVGLGLDRQLVQIGAHERAHR